MCCAGIWGPKIARMVGMNLPLTPLAHQLAWTGPVPALEGQAEEAVRPILRHQDADLYYRDRFDRHRHRLLRPPAHARRPPRTSLSVDDAEQMPSVLQFTEDDFADAWAETQALLPATRDAKVEEGINGLFSFTTDGTAAARASHPTSRASGSPRPCGSPTPPASAARWPNGSSTATARPSTCTSATSTASSRTSSPRSTSWPATARTSSRSTTSSTPSSRPARPRPLRTSPFHARQQELGAVFLEATGWERPQWYEANDAPASTGATIPTPNDWAARYWSPIVGAEAQATRETVAMYDMTALKRLEVTGRGAAAFLQRLTTGNVDKSVGSVTYTLLLDEDGGIRSDITVARLGRDHFQVGANGNLDLDWFRRHLPADGSVQVRDITAGTCCIGLWGPLAREVLQPLADADFSNDGLRYFRAKRAHIGSVPVTAMRLSYVGELRLGAVHHRRHGPEAVGHPVGRPPSRTAASPPAAAPSTACAWRRATAPSAPT